MRSLLAALALAVLPGFAYAGAPETLFAERTALLAADRACGLFEPALRAALDAAARQARSTLLRADWTAERVDKLSAAAAAEGGARPCADPAVVAAAAGAKAGFESWSRLPQMRFAGWLARRTPDPDGYFVRQDAAGGAFGLGRDGPVLLLPHGEGAPAPAAARLYLPDPAAFDGRLRPVAARASGQTFWASGRRVETKATRFSFPPAAAVRLAALDPRQTVEAEIDAPVGRRTLKFEAGDFAAAAAFLGLTPR